MFGRKNMKKIKKYFLSRLDIITVFAISLIFSFFSFWNVCKLYPHGDFDSQASLTWDYNAAIGMLPYKEVWYPYGILSYYKDHQIFFSLLYILILPILLTLLYFVLKSVFHKKLIAIIILFLFSLFITYSSGWETFNRYGILTISTLYFTYALYTYKGVTKKFLLLCGISSGIIFSFVTDQGVYVGVVFIALLLLSQFLRNKKISIKMILSQIGIFIVGYCIGLLPLLYFLYTNHMIYDFIFVFYKLLDIALYAKAPFLPGSKTAENLFTLSALFLSIFFLSWSILFIKKKLSLSSFLQISLIGVLIILEQKNLMRSIDQQLVFTAVLLIIFFFYDLFSTFGYTINSSEKKPVLIPLGIYFSLLILFCINVRTFPSTRVASDKACLNKNMDIYVNRNNYIAIKNIIPPGKKIFSFPGNPVFYLFFQQKTPNFLSTYETSPIYAQKEIITYLKRNQINYIIYDSSITAIQDGVPEYVRSSTELSYILTHYTIVKKFNNFLIFEHTSYPVDIFVNPIIKDLPDFKNYLLSIDLKNIPASEGMYKNITRYNTIISSNKIQIINNYLLTHVVNSQNIVFVVRPSNYLGEKSEVTFEEQSGLKTTITYRACKIGSLCIIKISNLPLFYINKQLKNISLSHGLNGEFSLVKDFSGDLW